MLPARNARRSRSGFTLIECLVVVAVIGIIAAIAIPNLSSALRKSRHTSAYKSAKVLEGAVLAYMLDRDSPPSTVNTRTLEPLVTGGYIRRDSRNSILGTFERGQLIWYYGVDNIDYWGFDYGISFRPRKDPASVQCYLWPEGIWRWEGNTWTQVW